MMALSDRGTIDLQPLPPVRQRPDVAKAPIDGPGQRPVIQLAPPTDP